MPNPKYALVYRCRMCLEEKTVSGFPIRLPQDYPDCVPKSWSHSHSDGSIGYADLIGMETNPGMADMVRESNPEPEAP